MNYTDGQYIALAIIFGLLFVAHAILKVAIVLNKFVDKK
jgi:hypothetical protein